MDDYVSKPIKPDMFKALLERLTPQKVTGPGEPGTGEEPESLPITSVLDIEEALARVEGDREFLAELSEIFLEECPTLVSAIQAAVANNDPEALHRSAHILKGSVGNFGAKATFEAARALEAMGRQAELSGAAAALTVLEQELARLQPALASLKLKTTA